MTYVKLEDAIKTVKAIEVPVGGFDDKIDAWLKAIDIAAGALATLPTVSVTDEMVEVAARAMCWQDTEIGSDCEKACLASSKCLGDSVAHYRREARTALEAALGATVSDGEVLAKFAAEQEPLGAEFEALYDANVEKLYDDDTVSDGWEDIATAPKDGTLFLGICPTGAGHPHYMHPFVMRHEGKLHSTFQYNNGAKWVDWPKPDPTNWKPLGPLPAPPTIE